MGHREKCLVRTPLADRSSTSAALCCCHCYSKSLCLDHCGQRERKVRATQAQTAPAPSTRPHPPHAAAFGDHARACWAEDQGCCDSCIQKKSVTKCSPTLPFICPPDVEKKKVTIMKGGVRGQPGGERHLAKDTELQELRSEKRERHHLMKT